MGMVGNYLIIDKSIIEEIKVGNKSISIIYNILESKEKDYLDIDKAWHAIHFVLCNDVWGGETPLYNLVLGGEIVSEEEMGYGPVRYLSNEEVREVYLAIKNIEVEDFKNSINLENLIENEIYPGFQNEDDCEYIAYYFEQLKKFFNKAYEEGKYMLLFIN